MKKMAQLFVVIIVLLFSGCQEYCYNTTPEVKFYLNIPENYEYIKTMKDTVLFRNVEQNTLEEITLNGETVFSITYPDEVFVTPNVIRCKTSEQYTFYSADGTKLAEDDFALGIFPTDFSKEINLTKGKDGLWGYTNQDAKWIISARYTYATPFSCDLAYVEMGNKCGFVNSEGEFKPLNVLGAIAKDYSNAPNFVDGRLLLQRPLVQVYGNEPSPSTFITDEIEELPSDVGFKYWGAPYQDALNFSDGLAAVKIDGYWGYIDTDGHLLVEPQFRKAYSFLNEIAIVEGFDGTVSFFSKADFSLQEISYIPDGYSPTGLHFDDLIVVCDENGQRNIVDSNGSFLLSQNVDGSVTRYYQIENSDPIWRMPDGIYLPKCRKRILGDVFYYFGSSLIVDNKYLYSIGTGEKLLEASYIERPAEGVALTLEKNKWGYLEPSGNWYIEPVFDKAYDFYNGIAYAKSGTIAGLLKKEDKRTQDKGTILLPEDRGTVPSS